MRDLTQQELKEIQKVIRKIQRMETQLKIEMNQLEQKIGELKDLCDVAPSAVLDDTRGKWVLRAGKDQPPIDLIGDKQKCQTSADVIPLPNSSKKD